jgi:ornithine decarboxylase
MHLVVKVITRKGDAIYLNDGIYGNLWELATGDIVPQTYVISQQQGALLERAKEKRAFTIYGPTCDNVDVLPHRWFLNQDITTGDYIILQNMGAYSFVSTTSFNGFGGYDILSLH